MTVVDRFLQYVKFDTQSDEETNMTPSTPGQMIFAQHLENELRTMGLKDISLDENGYLMATLPGNIDKEVPTVGFIAHLDTSPDMSGRHVTPRIVQPGFSFGTKEKKMGIRGSSTYELIFEDCSLFNLRFKSFAFLLS